MENSTLKKKKDRGKKSTDFNNDEVQNRIFFRIWIAFYPDMIPSSCKQTMKFFGYPHKTADKQKDALLELVHNRWNGKVQRYIIYHNDNEGKVESGYDFQKNQAI